MLLHWSQVEGQPTEPDVSEQQPPQRADRGINSRLNTITVLGSVGVEQQSGSQPAPLSAEACNLFGSSTAVGSPSDTSAPDDDKHGLLPGLENPQPGHGTSSTSAVTLMRKVAGSSSSGTSLPPRPLPAEAEFISFTVPHYSPTIPSRPEFTPFTVPYLCASSPYDRLGFWTYPQRHGWIVHITDTACHVLCPPGRCHQALGEDSGEDAREPNLPIFSRVDETEVQATDKAAFLQAWLFFGVLDEVSALCGLEIDVGKEFLTPGRRSFSTAKLNGLSRRWFDAAKQMKRAGDKSLMERVMSVARHTRLMLTEELKVDEDRRKFEYTYAECRIFQSLEIVIHLIGLHLLSHANVTGFTATEEEGWGRERVLKCLEAAGYSEGIDQLSSLAQYELGEKGWCPSQIELMAPHELAFASLLERPRIRDHSGCEDRVCGAYQTDEKTYKTRHVNNECQCAFVEAESALLVDALAQGRVPKVIVTDQLELEVFAEDGYPYIALSHVCTFSMYSLSDCC